MDKYKTNTAFNKWFSAIKLGKTFCQLPKCILITIRIVKTVF